MSGKNPKIVGQSGYFAKVLIVDEIGLPVDKITDDLLSRGCLVYLVTKNEKIDPALVQKANLYIVQPKELKTISLLDNLIVIHGRELKNSIGLDNYPKAYRVAIFGGYHDLLTTIPSGLVQLIAYEEIVDETAGNKLDRLVALRAEGCRITIKEGGNYYPVTSRCLGEMIGLVVSRSVRAEKIWLKSTTYSWSVLVQKINQSYSGKTKRDATIELPMFIVSKEWTPQSCPADIETEINKRLSVKADQSTAIPKVDKLDQDKRFRPLLTNKTPIKIPFYLPQINRPRRSMVYLLASLLLLINISLLSRFLANKVITSNLNSYSQRLSDLFDTKGLANSTSWLDVSKSVNRLNFWWNKPFCWLLSSEIKTHFPSRLVNQNLLQFLSSLEKQKVSELQLTQKWLTGQLLTDTDWDNLESKYLQTIEWLSTAAQYAGDQDGLVALKGDSGLKTWLVNYKQKLEKEREAIVLWQKLLTDKPTQLLVLVQNNYELRPTGGLVSAYGLVTLQNGHKPTGEFYDSSTLDAKIIGHIQPPVEITNQLGENTWYFRDINWEPDLAVSANRAIWYYENTEKAVVDGVLVTDINFWFTLKQWLAREEATTQNELFTDLVTASAGQKDTLSAGNFLAGYAGGIFKQLVNLQPGSLTDKTSASFVGNSFGDLIYRFAEEKNIAFYLKDLKTETTLAKLGWDGKIKVFNPPKSDAEIYADYFMVNEANIGINLVNRFVTRKVQQQITFNEQEKDCLTTLSYQNTSSLSTWPGGTYQAYVRIYLPDTVNLRSITTENQNGQRTVDPIKINGSQFDDKAVYGWRVEVGPGEVVNYLINYSDKDFNSKAKIRTYLLLVQKQIGMDPFDYNLTVKSGTNLIPLRSIPSGIMSATDVSIDAVINKDKIFQVDFGQ